MLNLGFPKLELGTATDGPWMEIVTFNCLLIPYKSRRKFLLSPYMPFTLSNTCSLTKTADLMLGAFCRKQLWPAFNSILLIIIILITFH